MTTTMSRVRETGRMDTSPRAEGPRRRRAFTPADKLAHLAAYEQAAYIALVEDGVSTRTAATLTGIVRSTPVSRIPTEMSANARLRLRRQRC